MDAVDYLVVGAGVSGLSFANWIRAEAAERGAPAPSMIVVEADDEPGGYCKTVTQDGFVWDYSGHFFHFRDPSIEGWLRARMPGQDVRTVVKRSFIRFAGQDIDFPFQKNIHQLPRQDFIDCLVDLYFAAHGDRRGGHGEEATAPASFKAMLYARFGRGIADKFLIPYNEKLYACDLDDLDPGAMGRFFPHADIADIISNMRRPDNAGYNATFTYPRGGAIQYVHALLRDLPPAQLCYGERLVGVDLSRKVATTARRGGDGGGGWGPGRDIRFGRLVSSAPLPALLAACRIEAPPGALSSNQVVVFNLGFDRKGDRRPHWIYFPERDYCFYRVGFYDNIMDGDGDGGGGGGAGDDDGRMSLYVEIGAAAGARVDVDAMRARVLADLARAGIVAGHRLVSWHSVVLDPAYVHVTGASRALWDRLAPALHAAGVYPVGRYGGWTYCSIEDNMLETRALAARFALSM